MPQTAALVLLGAAAISALPPLNAFASEWLLFQAVLTGPRLDPWLLKFLVPAVGAALALAAALAAACFVRAYGLAFLGRPRSDVVPAAHDPHAPTLAAMAGLAVLCVLLGVLPGPALDLLAPALRALTGTSLADQAGRAWLTLVPETAARSSYNGLIILLFLAISGTLTALVVHRVAGRRVRRAPAWDCGFPVPTPITQYGAGSFAQPLRRFFGTVLAAARETVDMPGPGERRAATHTLVVADLAWELLYKPLAAGVWWLSGRLNVLQFLTIRRYLTLVFGALVVLLVLVAAWP